MKLRICGAAQTVTGSQYLIEINGTRVLLECGLFQGRRQETYTRNQNFPFDPRRIDVMLLSHAHIDHSGNIPNLVKQGFDGPIFATPPTVDLAKIMLLDSAHIQESDTEYVNFKHAKRGEPPVEPLYTIDEAEQAGKKFSPIGYNKPFEPAPGLTVHFVDAGHILGSAAMALELEEKGHRVRLWFSGDIGRPDLPLLRDPILPADADYLLMESTYGDKPHRDPDEAFDEFSRVVTRTIKRGGKVIIPAFAVGRTQELVYFLHKMVDDGRIPAVPIFVDSPLAVNASDIFKKHPECFDEETMAFMKEGHPALEFANLTYTRSVDESKALNGRKEPMIIISASGMAENGRIRHHIRNNIEDPNSTILIVSWQAPDTLGRLLADRAPSVMIFGEKYRCKAEIATIGGLSAHAGQDFLLEYANALRGRAKQVILVHGEEKAATILKDRMEDWRVAPRVDYPKLNTVLEF
jgi:metallo-beta-lactamase family protein